MKPEKKFGFAIVNNELGDFDILHYFKLKGYGYKSACKEAVYRPPNLGLNTLILQDLNAFKETIWCKHCHEVWLEEVETAKQIILANQ